MGRVLIVDDDPAVSSITATMFRALGYGTVVAWGVKSALDIWRETGMAFDLAVIDYTLDDGEGTTVAQRLKADKPSIPVVMATGMNRADLDLPQGVHYIAKPYTMVELDALVKELMGG